MADRSRPKVCLTGFSPFPGAPVNPTQMLIDELQGDAGDLADLCELHVSVLPVAYATIGEELAGIARCFEPDIALHFGLSSDADGFRIERTARNAADPLRVDNEGILPATYLIAGGPPLLRSTLPMERIEAELARADLPVTIDDSAGDYLCNAVFYLSRSASCGGFRPSISGFVHVPQLTVADGGMPGEGKRLSLDQLVEGARLIVRVCVAEWDRKVSADLENRRTSHSSG